MKHNLSIKTAWYSLIFLLVLLPLTTLLVWGGNVFYNSLIKSSLQQEKHLQKMVNSFVAQEMTRLVTVMENKADPMAYALNSDRDKQLLDDLLIKIITREPSIHILLLLDINGEIITGREFYDKTSNLPALKSHWQSDYAKSLPAFTNPLNGDVHVGAVNLHPEGSFFTVSVPVIREKQVIAVLLAEIDANIMWQDIQPNLSRNALITYMVDSSGKLLIVPENSGHYIVSDYVDSIPLVKLIVNKQQIPDYYEYKGISDKAVYGLVDTIDSLGWFVITEIDQESILEPIRKLVVNWETVVLIVLTVFVWFGLFLVNRIIKPVDAISADFKRVANRDYSSSSITTSFSELSSMVDSFNHMVHEIEMTQNHLLQASVVFDTTSEGIVITDANQNIQNVNNSFTEITGYSKDDALGKMPSLFKSGRHEEEFYQMMWQSIKQTGMWRGEIWNRRKNGSVFPELLTINTVKNESGEVTNYIAVFTDISLIKETERKLEYLAHHDALTGLPNRLLCIARLSHELQSAKRNGAQVAVLFLDLDMFKHVNDSMGHEKGDYLLQLVAERMTNHVREEDTVARLGGDEFVVVLGKLTSAQDAATCAKNFLALFSMPFIIDEHEVFVGASIGISIYPDDGDEAGALLRNADAAMYRAKSEGRNNYQFYTAALTENAVERMSLETSLRYALEKQQLRLHYQPQYLLDNNRLIGAEALLRWDHPEMGMIPPDKFITVAEETGMIVAIGEWVLRQACQQIKLWQSSDYPVFKMAVNLSARQFRKPGLAKLVATVLHETGIEASLLELELTESILIDNTAVINATLNELHQMGVSLSIDDFGTGYSSLSYINRFPIDKLKIDRSFVRDIMTSSSDADMIISIIALGHSMKLNVLAEGVETAEQLDFLRVQGCDEVQGYYYSPAVSAEAFTKLLDDM